MRRWLVVLSLLGLWAVLTAETYNNDDIDRMKARYEGTRSVSKQALPREYLARLYEPPRLVDWMLPYQQWEKEYQQYFQAHYHDSVVTFKPSAIVMHYTVTGDAARVREAFLRGTQMSAGGYGKTRFGHVSVHLMISQNGTIYRLLPLDRRCTGAYGMNHVALSIEMVATDERDLLSRPRQIWASFCLVRHLMRQFGIRAEKIYGHHEVSIGKSVVPEYTDYADTEYPDSYPATYARSDPGRTYMKWLRGYLDQVGPAPEE